MDVVCVQCDKIFSIKDSLYYSRIKYRGGPPKFCSKHCKVKGSIKLEEYSCTECSCSFLRREKSMRRNLSNNKFCSQSCAASFNNKNKTKGYRRSKLEKWVEEELSNKYQFEIIFNGKDEINSELDIFIPHFKLAFELNGIFHYEPIYGEGKLSSIKNNDNRKFQACLEKNIELCIINTSSAKHFKKDRDKKYLDIIVGIIDNKITNELV